MRNVTVTTQLRIRMTADDWQLFDSPTADTEVDAQLEAPTRELPTPTREQIGQGLSEDIELVINGANSREQAENMVDRVLTRYRRWGASDTEGRAAVQQLLALRFPKA